MKMKPAQRPQPKPRTKTKKPLSSGIDAINNRILYFYPTQKNHIQATALTKYWNGGPDPLDYVSVLLNEGDESRHIPQHWHYISFGLSDLYGDGRVHEPRKSDGFSGYGLELTFRLKKLAGELNPPLWPSILMNALARYIFQTGNTINSGDHIPWDTSLDNAPNSNSLIHHMIITNDTELGEMQTEYGRFEFKQIVGITEEELSYIQKWEGGAVVSLMKESPQTGGPLLVTDMQRRKSVFDLNPKTKKFFFESMESVGSNLGHVMSVCSWTDGNTTTVNNLEEDRYLSSVVLRFDLEAASLLPLAMRLRLKKNKYFIYQNIAGQLIVLMPPDFASEMVTVSEETPLRVNGQSLQIFCSHELITAMSSDLALLENKTYLKDKLPVKFEISSPALTIMVLPEAQISHR